MALFAQVVSISHDGDFPASLEEHCSRWATSPLSCFLPGIPSKEHCCHLQSQPLSLQCTPEKKLLCLPVEIGRDDANICPYPSPHWTNQSAPASPHMAYPSATTFFAACHQAHYSLRSSLLCLGNRSGRGGKVALLNMAQIQPHEHQTPSPWTCWLCSCQPTLKPAHPGFSFTHQTTHHTTVVLLLSFCLYFQGVSLTA